MQKQQLRVGQTSKTYEPALCQVGRGSQCVQPAALGLPYIRGERGL